MLKEGTNVKQRESILARLPVRLETLFPTAPGHLRATLHAHQWHCVLTQVPMIYAVAILNLGIVMAVCAREGMSFASYGWMGVIMLISGMRMIQWWRRGKIDTSHPDPSPLLNTSVIVALVMISGLSIWTCYAYASGFFRDATFVPISLAFGATCIAHCLLPLRTAALGVLAIGILPSSFQMIVTGDFNARMLGLSMATIAVLLMRFVMAQYDQLITSLDLQLQVRTQADTDALTGLANRRAFMAEVEQSVDRGLAFGIGLIDLDGFKGVNDRLGHLAGDELLQHVAQKLVEAAGPDARVGRLGGDEFVLFFPRVTHDQEMAQHSTRVLASLCQPTIIWGHTLPVGASMGTALYPRDGHTLVALLGHADAALYEIKHERKADTRRGHSVVA
jgi:diguanylate cyclase